MELNNPYERIFVALDGQLKECSELIWNMPSGLGYKIGLVQIASGNASFLSKQVRDRGGRVFIDAKLYDIPNTVAEAVKRWCESVRPDLLNLHATGCLDMVRAAVQARDEVVPDRSVCLLAVTLLTSLNPQALYDIGLELPSYFVPNLAGRLKQWVEGLDGVVASSLEISGIRERCGRDFLVVTPGIRPAWAAADDQKRTDTPAAAIAAGADYLVIGRPITRPPDGLTPAAALEKIAAEVSEALAAREQEGTQ